MIFGDAKSTAGYGKGIRKQFNKVNVSFVTTDVECCLQTARNKTSSVSLRVTPRLKLLSFTR